LRFDATEDKNVRTKLDPAPKVVVPGGLVLAKGDTDKYGNPVRQGTDPDSGLPLEVCTPWLGMPLVLCPAGEFMMGSEKGDDSEKPVHRVRITEPFYMGKYQVTQEEYEKVTGDKPSNFEGKRTPVEWVSWDHCVKFCEALSSKEGPEVRLPTEAQWEYACRAGTTTEWCFGDDESGLAKYAWYDKNSESKTHPVGKLQPNAWGLYDVHGNVWEWCADWYDKDYYGNSPSEDPPGPVPDSFRVLRGGSWYYDALNCRSARRFNDVPAGIINSVGVRVCVCARAPN